VATIGKGHEMKIVNNEGFIWGQHMFVDSTEGIDEEQAIPCCSDHEEPLSKQTFGKPFPFHIEIDTLLGRKVGRLLNEKTLALRDGERIDITERSG